MKRNLIDRLAVWRSNQTRRPLFLCGIRGCGKTFLALDFAKTFYEGALYLNFEQRSEKRSRFLQLFAEFGRTGRFGQSVLPGYPARDSAEETGAKMERTDRDSTEAPGEETERMGRGIMEARGPAAERADESPLPAQSLAELLSAVFELPAEYLRNFLIILDEVMAAGELLKLFPDIWKQELPFSVMLLSSRALPESFLSPAYELHRLFPLQFDEFLCAVGSEWYAEVIKGHYQTNHKIPGIVHDELLERFEDYLLTGGMPAIVNEYIASESMDNVFELQQGILGKILFDISRYNEEGLALKMRQILAVVPEQLAKPNPKFQYRMLRRGAASAMYEPAIKQLAADLVLFSCRKLSDNSCFKLFPADIGLYSSIWSGIPEFFERTTLLERTENPISKAQYSVWRKMILECYMMQALIARGYQPVFWDSGSRAKIDFLIKQHGLYIPVEVKTEDGSRSKGLGIYRQESEIPYSFKISSHNFDFSGFTKQIPYYAVFCL